MSNQILHDHLDGGLRASTAKEIAKKIGYKPINEIDDVNKFFDRSNCESLEDYLEAFSHTIALMQTFENIEQIAYEAAADMSDSGINSVSYTHLRAHETKANLVCRLLLEKKKKTQK